MKITDHRALHQSLKGAGERYAEFLALFDAILEQATPVFADPNFRVKGISIDMAEDQNIRARFIDREVKLRFRYDGSGDIRRGVVFAEDWSYGVKEPVALWSFNFNGKGETDIDERDGAKFTLHDTTDCAEIIMAALESSITRKPE